MSRDKHAATQAVRALRSYNISFRLHGYTYQGDDIAVSAARALEIEAHRVAKTLVFEDENRMPFLVLMHGDQQVSAKALARVMGVKAVAPCDPKAAERHTGYVVGGISPFGTKKCLPIFVEESLLGFPTVFVNAGRRGLMAELAPGDLMAVLRPTVVRVAR